MSTLSVAIATYNGEEYIREQLDSILNQTLQPFEIIVCDDNSTDNTFLILEEYAMKDSRFKIFKNETNQGFLKNFERALSLTSGELIAPCDHDDIWMPDHLKILSEAIEHNSVAVGDAIVFTKAIEPQLHSLSYFSGLDYIADNNILKSLFIIIYQNPYQGASMLLKREFLNKAIPFPPGILYHDTWFAALGCYMNGLKTIPQAITYYRRHDKAVTGYKKRKSKFRRFLGHIILSRYLKDRPPYIKAIKSILLMEPVLKSNYLLMLDNLERFCNNRKTLLGRIKNIYFEIKYYKYIYGCK